MLEETSSSSNKGMNIEFKAKVKKSAPKTIKPQIVGSSSEDEDYDEVPSEEDEEELALLMKKFNRLNSKIDKKG